MYFLKKISEVYMLVLKISYEGFEDMVTGDKG